MTDRDIRRTAQWLIEAYGAEAPAVASLRARALAAQGDRDAGQAWDRIAAKVRELRALAVPFAIC